MLQKILAQPQRFLFMAGLANIPTTFLTGVQSCRLNGARLPRLDDVSLCRLEEVEVLLEGFALRVGLGAVEGLEGEGVDLFGREVQQFFWDSVGISRSYDIKEKIA